MIIHSQNPKTVIIKPENIKAIAIDLDGTVLGSDSQFSERTINVFKMLEEKGVQVIIATGRSVLAAEMYRKKLDLKGPLVYCNGAEVVDMPSMKLLYSRFLPLKFASFCAKLSKKEDVHFQVFLTGYSQRVDEIRLLANSRSESTDRYHERTGLNFQFGDISETLSKEPNAECIKGIFIGDEQRLDNIRKILNKKFGEKINLVLSANFILEVLSPNASKGDALLRALKYRNINPRKVISFGDEENDLSMFKVTGFSCAPLNARDAIKNAATFVVASNDDNGPAEYLASLFSL